MSDGDREYERQEAAWQAVGGEPGEDWRGGYIRLEHGEACVDGYYTPAELRRIADAIEVFS